MKGFSGNKPSGQSCLRDVPLDSQDTMFELRTNAEQECVAQSIVANFVQNFLRAAVPYLQRFTLKQLGRQIHAHGG